MHNEKQWDLYSHRNCSGCRVTMLRKVELLLLVLPLPAFSRHSTRCRSARLGSRSTVWAEIIHWMSHVQRKGLPDSRNSGFSDNSSAMMRLDCPRVEMRLCLRSTKVRF